MADISFDDFLAVDIRSGTIEAVEPNTKARKPAYIVTINFGDDIGLKKSSAQITAHYQAEDLVGRQVAAVVNFPAKRIAGIKSEVLILGFADAGGDIVLVHPERQVPDGERLM